MDISITCWLGATAAALALLFMASGLRWFRALVAEVAAALLVVAAVCLLVSPLLWWVVVAGCTLLAGLGVLAARLVVGRLADDFLRISTRRNVLGFAAGTLVLLALAWLSQSAAFTSVLLHSVAALALLLCASLLAQAIWTLRHFTLASAAKHSLKDLPTVTLAIPARNETHALTECLTAAVASTYLKLEIIVLDDCSQDNTSALIRSFAQEGVRFIRGEQPTEGWLGKNQALEALAKQASGEYIIFADVDTRLAPDSIPQLVDYALERRAQMVSVLPQCRDGLTGATLFWQLRYFWQIVLPITKRRVPVATQAWLINADSLRQLGGFGAVKQKIAPESWFARQLHSKGGYRFVISDERLGFTTAKKWSSQAESAIRYLYPTYRRQPLAAVAGAVAMASFAGLFWWSATVVVHGFSGHIIAELFVVLAAGLLLLTHGFVAVRVLPQVWLFSVLALPFTLLQEALLTLASLVQYEFGEVNWKGRNVCYPVIARPPRELEPTH